MKEGYLALERQLSQGRDTHEPLPGTRYVSTSTYQIITTYYEIEKKVRQTYNAVTSSKITLLWR